MIIEVVECIVKPMYDICDVMIHLLNFFFSSRRRHTRCGRDWSSDVCSSDLLDDVDAAALPLAGLTAWQALVETADVQPGDRVLVLAAAGGVGHLAVQIAK